ncbi:hypothetical protein LEN_2264 [Lysobacter enzymogenes]|uniref:Uncharacterized protein n=1 Tax=Lysobacter enzymogenes TaxID=69 RepID=A0AAU9AV08_LYSEN|nr:hypothetical protein LEN_2264 [Lysobacter enzymogenes]
MQRATPGLAQPTYRHARKGVHPGLHPGMALKSLDPRLRGDDGLERRGEPTCRETQPPRNLSAVMPAKAGIQGSIATRLRQEA